MSDVLQTVTEITEAQTVKAGLERILVHMMEWHPGAADNDLLVKDGQGQIIFKARAAGAAPNGEAAYVVPKTFDCICLGLVVETIDGGTLYIFTG